MSSLRARLSGIRRNPRYLGRTIFPKSQSGSQLHASLSRLLSPLVSISRSKLEDFWGQDCPLEIRQDDGFLAAPTTSKSSQVAELAKKIWLSEQAAETDGGKTLSKKAFLHQLPLEIEDPVSAPIFDFASSPEVVLPIRNYFGSMPYLINCKIWYSPNDQVLGRSQFFHRDGEDTTQIKCFINIDEVTEATGPFSLLSAKDTSELMRKMKNDGVDVSKHNLKYEDEIVFKYVNPEKVIRAVGPAGQYSFVDTSRCLHYGSRPLVDNSQGRLVLMLHFSRAFSRELPTYGKVEQPVNLPGEFSENDRKRHQEILSMFYQSYFHKR
ncbi:hypothetical protein [uncultured Thalassospira sp.]|uniref:hypothetical protein n=1 Tax=uncultured Thalassospira sp. TaxID=404382 RepID=UPI00258C50F6|nr:hypothetical protein [uncultured Thalassospira sp.]